MRASKVASRGLTQPLVSKLVQGSPNQQLHHQPEGREGGHVNGYTIDNYIKNTLSLHSNGVFYSINGVPIEEPSVPPVPREEDAIVGSEPQVTINETVYDQNPRPATRKSQVLEPPLSKEKRGMPQVRGCYYAPNRYKTLSEMAFCIEPTQSH